LVVLLNSLEHTERYVIATLATGRYRVKWMTGVAYGDRITTVTADEIRKKT